MQKIIMQDKHDKNCGQHNYPNKYLTWKNLQSSSLGVNFRFYHDKNSKRISDFYLAYPSYFNDVQNLLKMIYKNLFC